MTNVAAAEAGRTEAQVYADALAADPKAYLGLSVPVGFQLDREQRDRVALAGLRRRFAELRPQVSVLDRMAEEQGIAEIASIEDSAALLFPHTVYKSYPLSVLERGQFDRLTRWLQGLTARDLGGVSLEGVETIDGWIEALDRQAGVQIVHTSGTTGKLSFLPRDTADQDDRLRLQAANIRDWHGVGTGPDILGEARPVIYPSYRSGSSTMHRTVDSLIRLVARDEANVLTLYPGAFSADIASLAGRLRAAEARGEKGQLEISPALLSRRQEAVELERDRPRLLDRFFADAEGRFRGRDVMLIGVKPLMFEWAEPGLERGLRRLFGPGTVLMTGGGNKGRALPDNAMDMITDFLGCEDPVEMYGMSEMTGLCRRCARGNHHIPPYIVPLVLDEQTGAILPRSGRQTGRFGFVDLYPADHWGGFLTGDRVTVGGWDESCACGRTGPYVEPGIERFSDLQGGDDKITCAGAAAAHDKALEFLANIAT